MNDHRIAQALTLLQSCLRTFVEERMRKEYKDRWLEHACSSLLTFRVSDTANPHLDVQALIRIATDKRHQVLYNSLSIQGRNCLHELREVRNRHAHQNEFTEREIERALDTLEIFLTAIQSLEAAQIALLRTPAAPAAQKLRSTFKPAVPISPVNSDGEFPECDFVYFATPACASWTITAEFVESSNAIIAHAHNRLGQRMPLIPHLRPGHKILLAYGTDGQYSPVFLCEVRASPEPVITPQHTFDVFCYIPDPLHDKLKAGGYAPDPVIQQFVGISIVLLQDLRGDRRRISKPKGNNTLRRRGEVFPSDTDGAL